MLKLIARSPSSSKGNSLLYLSIIIVIILCVFFIFKSGNKSSAVDLSESIQIAASSLLEKDPTISEFTIDTIKLSHENMDSEEVYIMTFSIKPTDPANYILTGGGIKGENGWIHERVNYVTVKDKETLVFSNNPLEDH